MMLSGAGTATFIKNHHMHLDRNPSDTQIKHTISTKNSLGCFLYHHTTPPLHFIIWCECMVFEGLFKHPKIWKSHRKKARLYAEFLNSFHCVAFSWFCTLWATCSGHCGVVGWCHQCVYPGINFWSCYADFELFDIF